MYKGVELVAVTINHSLQVTYKLFCLLVRVAFVDTVSSLSISYELAAERTGEERSGVDTVNQVFEREFQCFRFSIAIDLTLPLGAQMSLPHYEYHYRFYKLFLSLGAVNMAATCILSSIKPVIAAYLTRVQLC